MTPFRPTRAARRPDPFVRHKIFIFSLGAGGAFAGMIFDAAWLITVGIIVLAVGVMLRLVTERRARRIESLATDEAGDDAAGAAENDTGSRDGNGSGSFAEANGERDRTP